MKTILITAIGRRVSLLRHLVNSELRVVGADINPDLAPASQVAYQVYQVPRWDNDQYIESLMRICEKENVGLLIPLFEPEFIAIAQHKKLFEKIGTRILLSDRNALDKCLDKHLLYLFFRRNDVRTPETYLPNEFPITSTGKWVVKPRKGMASQHVHFCENVSEVQEVTSSVDSPIIQRFIRGIEYTIDAFVDGKGNIRSIVPRERLEIRAGEVTKSITRSHEQIIEQSKRILELLPFYGPITLQGIVDKEENEFFFTEINPRFGGGVTLAIQAGIPYGDLLRYELEESYDESHILPYENNLLMLRYDDAFYISEVSS